MPDHSVDQAEADLMREALRHLGEERLKAEDVDRRRRESLRRVVPRARDAGLTVPEIARLTRMTTRNAYYFLRGER